MVMKIDNGPSYADSSSYPYSDLAQAQGIAPGSDSGSVYSDLAQAQGWAVPDAGSSYNLTPVDYSNPSASSSPDTSSPAPAPAPAPAPNYPAPAPNYPAPAPNYPAPAPNGGGGGGGGNNFFMPSTPAPQRIIHNAQEYINNGQAYTDPTYEMQKAALIGKLNDYERQVANRVGSQNLSQVNVPQDDKNYGLLGSYYKGNALGNLYKTTQDQNGNNNYESTGALDGGTMGTDFNTAIANFQNQQQQGLRNLAEGYAARGMLGGEGLGGGSGVWQNARSNLEDQYNNQIGNINNSVIGQYNDLLSNLADQYSQGNQSLTGYLGDASNRMATAANAGLPVG